MPKYDYIDVSIRGLKSGSIDDVIDGRYVCAQAAGIEFGTACFAYKGDELNLYTYINDTAKLVFDADFITGNLIDGTVNTVAWTQVPFDTDQLTTANNLVSAIAALDGVDCELDATDTNNRTFLIRTKGAANTTTAVVTGGASQAGAAITYGSAQIFVGVSIFTQNDSGLYEQYDAVNVMVDGMVVVQPAVTILDKNKAYVDNASTDLGEFTSSANGVEVNARYQQNISADGLGQMRIYGPTEMTYFGNF